MLGLGAMLALAGPAFAGGSPICGVDCYREAVLPPVYGTVSERVRVQGPRTHDIVVPARYATVEETVLVAPARREWRVTRDALGHRVGCWVHFAAEYAVRPRTVMVKAAQSVPYTTYPVYDVRQRSVLVEPARRGWVPVAEGAYEGY
jgi:hypothetical protein